MGVQETGLTLEGLAQRLEALERENGRMRSENAELRDEVAVLKSSGTRWDGPAETRSLIPHREGRRGSGYEGLVSKRALLGKAGAAAVAAVAAGTLMAPRQAKADHATNTINAFTVDAHFVKGSNLSGGLGGVVGEALELGVEGRASDPDGYGVLGRGDTGVLGVGFPNGTGVRGTARYGVWGESTQAGFYGVTGRNTNTDGTGVRGVANDTDGRTGVRGEGATDVWGSSSKTGYSGVYGQHTGTSGYGIVEDGKGGSAGVLGRNSEGTGVRGEGSTSAEVAGVRGLGTTGVWGSSSSTGYSGLYGQHTGSAGHGVVGDGKGAAGAGILGRNGSGYGGQFEGGKAQLMLKPGGSAGKPSGAHSKGEIYMDSAGSLFVCVVGGNPAKWRKLSTTAV